VTPRVLAKDLVALGQHMSVIRTTGPPDRAPTAPRTAGPLYTGLMIADEADRLKTRAWSSHANTTTAARWA